jgi:predicted RNase H-like HicB family nuclease
MGVRFIVVVEDGGYVVDCPALPGCVSEGKTLEESLENIREAMSLHLEGEDLKELGISPDLSVLVNLELEYATAQSS